MKENSIEEDIERLELCSTNQCYICGRYEKEECMLERNRCEAHILSDYKRVLSLIEEQDKKIRELERKQKENIVIVRDDTIRMYEQTEMDLESKITDLEIENKKLKEDMRNMYDEEVVISIICDNFNLTRNEVLNLLGD